MDVKITKRKVDYNRRIRQPLSELASLNINTAKQPDLIKYITQHVK